MSSESAADVSKADATSRLVGEDIITGYGSQEIIHGVSIRSHDGVTCIFGPNGSGKSTLLKALNGVVPVWSGTVTYGGTEVTDYGAHEMVESGVVTLPQNGGLFPNLSVRENLLLGGYTIDDKDLVEQRIGEVLEAFPALEDKMQDRTKELSGGQQMMVSFGRAMITGADIYLLDEPSAGLAPSLVDDVIEQVRHLVDVGAQIVLVEQNVRAALRIADYVYIVAQGEIQFGGPPSELQEEDKLIELYLGLG